MTKLLFIVLFPLSLLAQNNRGSSDLGLCSTKYNYQNFISQFREATTIRTKYLDNTFNVDGQCPNARKLMREPKALDLMLVLLNGPGLRNGRLERHEIHYGYTITSLDKAIRQKKKSFLDKFRVRLAKGKRIFMDRSAPFNLLINTCLECDLSKESRKILNEVAHEYFPNAIYVDNPLRDSCIPGLLCEKHGAKASPSGVGSVDLDGEDYDAVDQKKYAQANAGRARVYAWHLSNNGFKKDEAWRRPTQRVNFLSGRDAKQVGAFVKPGALQSTSSVTDSDKNGCHIMFLAEDGYKKGSIFKLGDGRSHAVWLAPHPMRFKAVKIIKNGAVVDTGRFRALYAHDPAGKQRQVWDFTKHTSTYPDNVIIKATANNGKVSCAVLQLPVFRVD